MLLLVRAGRVAPGVTAALVRHQAELGAHALVHPLGDALGGLHAEAVHEQLLGELAVLLELLAARGHLGADRDRLQHAHVALATLDRAVVVRQAEAGLPGAARGPEAPELSRPS